MLRNGMVIVKDLNNNSITFTKNQNKYSFDLFIINRKKNKHLIAVIGKMNSAFLNLHVINFEV